MRYCRPAKPELASAGASPPVVGQLSVTALLLTKPDGALMNPGVDGAVLSNLKLKVLMSVDILPALSIALTRR